MNHSSPAVLGLIAGGAIFLGLPIARIKAPAPRLRLFLNAFATGILLFLFVDVLTHAYVPVAAALERLHQGTGSALSAIGWALLFIGGLGLGLLSLVHYNRFLKARSALPSEALSAEKRGAGLVPPAVLPRSKASWFAALSPSRQTAFLIAIGIGLHNFAEGLAIGQSAAAGEISLATVLVIGFALHNATEGFGIAAPMAAQSEHPPWSYLILLGIIGGGPTFFGAIIGGQFTSSIVSVMFLTLAAGSILYVILQLLAVAFRQNQPRVLAWGLFIGLAAGFATDMIVSAAGA